MKTRLATRTTKPAFKRAPKAVVECAVPAAPKGDVDDVIVRLLNTPTKENVDLIERLLKIRAERAFNIALRAAQEDIPRVVRDAANETTRSKYARLETVAKVVNPATNKHGFVLSFGTETSPLQNHYRIICDLSHIAGHMRTYRCDVPADTVGMKGNINKTPTHAMGSAMTYGRRYLMLMMFNMVLVNQDDDGNMGAVAAITKEQSLVLHNLIEKTALAIEDFYTAYKISDVEELPAAKYDEALKRLNDREAEFQRRQRAKK
jgi:hypothetical protein